MIFLVVNLFDIVITWTFCDITKLIRLLFVNFDVSNVDNAIYTQTMCTATRAVK